MALAARLIILSALAFSVAATACSHDGASAAGTGSLGSAPGGLTGSVGGSGGAGGSGSVQGGGGQISGGSIGAGGGAAASAGGGGSAGVGGDAVGVGGGAMPLEPATLQLMEAVVFYDGYAGVVSEPAGTGVVRLSNSLLTTRLREEQLASIQENLELEVLIGALCDNYDRIGSVHLAFVPKGQEEYSPGEVQRIEIARFITPFMDKNRQPDIVPYSWDITPLAGVIRHAALAGEFDLWMELSVFGVPYAANEEVAGCAERSDVFRGWMALRTNGSHAAIVPASVLPLALEEPFNDYTPGASDELGKTRKTIEFELGQAVAELELFLITSNHGANQGGEEYVRREHFVYVDGELVLQYLPGRSSCEPFRQYNTQGNGIYGTAPRSDQEWQSFSNWCPGDVIDTRVISLGAMAAGTHQFVIEVPEAIFADNQGNFPVSLYATLR